MQLAQRPRAVASEARPVRRRQRAVPLLEQHPRVPAVRQVWGWAKAVAVLASRQDLTRRQHTRGAQRKVVDAQPRAEEAAHWLCRRRQLQPLIQRAALVAFEVAEA